MAVQDEVRDPWTYVVGALAGGAALATGLFIPPVAIGIGVAVAASKVLTGAFFKSDKRRAMAKDRRLPVITRTPEAAWLARAGQAQAVFDDIADSAHDGPIGERVRSFGDETAESLRALERLAGQASAIRSAMARLDPAKLAWERDRLLKSTRPGEDPRVLAERERSLSSVQGQLDTYARLDGTLRMLLARLESGTLAIEGLVARLAEVVALAETTSVATDGVTQVEELAHELEGLRAGLVEAESVSTRAMQGLAPLPSPAPDTVPTADTTRVRRRAGGE
jgi:hypothetical protein